MNKFNCMLVGFIIIVLFAVYCDSRSSDYDTDFDMFSPTRQHFVSPHQQGVDAANAHINSLTSTFKDNPYWRHDTGYPELKESIEQREKNHRIEREQQEVARYAAERNALRAAEQEAARKAEQEAARKAEQEAARKAAQDVARKAERDAAAKNVHAVIKSSLLGAINMADRAKNAFRF